MISFVEYFSIICLDWGMIMLDETRNLWLLLAVLVALVAGAAVEVEASPKDIRGSSNVAVAAYHNRSGDFVLWSSGRITDLEGKEVNASDQYNTSFASAANRMIGHLLGSPNVAVGVLTTVDATLVVFSDGSVRKPRNAAAAAPGAGHHRIVCGVNVKEGMSKAGTDGWSAAINAQRSLTITFNKAFDRIPVFIYNCTPRGNLVAAVTGCCCTTYSVSISASKVTIIASNNNGSHSYDLGRMAPSTCTFAAFSDD